jgi:acyl-CoA thioester hydrolase
MNLPRLEDFPSQTYDKLRYADTDRQGHINNAMFVTFCETGRVNILRSLAPETMTDAASSLSMVIARLCLDYRKEIFWPGTVEIGTGIKAIGRSSITYVQGLFQNGVCVATAESVVVLVDNNTGRSTPMDEESKAHFQRFMMSVES